MIHESINFMKNDYLLYSQTGIAPLGSCRIYIECLLYTEKRLRLSIHRIYIGSRFLDIHSRYLPIVLYIVLYL